MADPYPVAELLRSLQAQSSSTPPAQAAAQSPSAAHDILWPQVQQRSNQPSPLFSPPQTMQSSNPHAHPASGFISPLNSPSNMVGSSADPNRAVNLLNLLKSSTPGSQAGPMADLQNVSRTPSGVTSEAAAAAHNRPLSAVDLMANVARPASSSHALPSQLTNAGAEASEHGTTASANSNFLLNLLKAPPKENQPKPAEMQKEEVSVDKLAHSFAEASIQPGAQPPREPTPVRHFGSADAQTTPFEAPQPLKPSPFTYINPFDALHSSSPLNRSPQPPVPQAASKKMEILKHDRDVSSNLEGESTAPASKSRKLTPDIAPSPAAAEKGKSVSEALEGVGKTADKQADEALAQADAQDQASKASPADTGDNAADDQPVHEADDVDTNWESAEDEEAEKDKVEQDKTEDFTVKIFNFPMKPFVSIRIKPIDDMLPLRLDQLQVIATGKKEFDQIDRNLITASREHIVYARPAGKKEVGGMRIIRQDTGQDKEVFVSNRERVFNVQICDPPVAGGDVETVLATGINGSVFWTSLSKSGAEQWETDDVEGHGFIMPPVATPEEQSSGSPVKTRAKMSSRHTEYFGIARGKQIHIISPEIAKGKAYCSLKTRKIDTEKYLAEHGLKIMTGKAGKDFCFSEDDSTIVSLDKSGRFKFWDIKDLTRRATDSNESKHEPIELREPIWSLTAATSGSKPDEKPSVSSIMFLDKERPTQRGIALRYMLIGFKQNHILQLWDLGLGKAVQEVRLPHERDSDGICSVVYQPYTGIIGVGHPTRNSVYFIHLSAPKYTIAQMDQAKYVTLLARSDPSLPRPDSTAIMSGVREFSLAKLGQLRSLDMLKSPAGHASDPDNEDSPLFEIYAMHSRGTVYFPIKRKDLGWDHANKLKCQIDGEQAGVIEVEALAQPAKLVGAQSEQSSNADASAKQISKPAPARKSEPVKPAAQVEVIKRGASATNGSTASAEQPKQVAEPPEPSAIPNVAPGSYAMAAQRAEKLVQDANAAKRAIPTPQISANDDVQTMLNKQFDTLYQRIDADKRVQEASGAAKQDAVLRLVSSTLTENVEKSLNRIVSDSMAKEIIPAISTTTSKAVEKKISELLPPQLQAQVSKEIKAALPTAVAQAFKDPAVHQSISTSISQKVQQQLSHLLQQAMPNIATQATQKMISDLENRTKQQLQQAETRREEDNAKIEQLSTVVQNMSAMIQKLSENQTAFQDQVLKLQGRSIESSTEAEEEVPAAPTQEQLDAAEEARIMDLLVQGEYNGATVAWLQSTRQGELFDRIFVRVNARYLEKVTPLIALSVSVAVTASLDSFVDTRLEWLGLVLTLIDYSNPEIKDVFGRIMDVLSQRLQGAYMNLSEQNPNEPALKKISALNRQVMDIRRTAP